MPYVRGDRRRHRGAEAHAVRRRPRGAEPAPAAEDEELADFLVYRPRPPRRAAVSGSEDRPRSRRSGRRGSRPPGPSGDAWSSSRRFRQCASSGCKAGGASRRPIGQASGALRRADRGGHVIGLLGGAVRPAAQRSRRARAAGASSYFGLERLLVLVAGAPPHKPVETALEPRLPLSPGGVRGRPGSSFRGTSSSGRARRTRSTRPRGPRSTCGDAVFLVGADEFADFLSWRDPNGVLEHVRLGVATRPGFTREQLGHRACSARRVRIGSSSSRSPRCRSPRSEIRARAARGEPIDGLVPPSVARLDRRARALPTLTAFRADR